MRRALVWIVVIAGLGGLLWAVPASSQSTMVAAYVRDVNSHLIHNLVSAIAADIAAIEAGLSQDASHDAAVIATGPQLMGECDDTATDAVDEGDAGRVRVNCTTRATYVSNVPVAASGEGATTHYTTSAASTNATSVKASAGNVYGFRLVNTTSTLYYLRMYNLATAPTCSSATGFVESIPIPHSTGAGAGVAWPNPVPQGYGTGIAFCLTGGGSSTDNTNAATGVYVTLLYK